MTTEKDGTPVMKSLDWGLSEDGTRIRLLCKAHTGETMAIHLADQELMRFMALLFEIAEKSASVAKPPNVESKRVTPKKIPVTQMGVGPGDHERDATMAIRTGLIELLFSVDAGILLDTLRQLEAIARPIAKPKLS